MFPQPSPHPSLAEGRTTKAFDDHCNPGDAPSRKESADRTPAVAQHTLKNVSTA